MTGSTPTASTRTASMSSVRATWPRETLPLLQQALTVEYASLTKAGAPVTIPLTPYVGDDGTTLDVSTGLTYPTKAERARRDPNVALLFADHIGSGLADAPIVLVQGTATVRDDDLQANTDRYVRLASAKHPAAFKGMPDAFLRRLDFYFARIWIGVVPTRILWWPHGDLTAAPEEWVDTAAMGARRVNPPRATATPTAVDHPGGEWRSLAHRALAELSMRDLTTVDGDGCPVSVPVRSAEVASDGIRLELHDGVATLVQPGPACLTAHDHNEAFTHQSNCTLRGTLHDGPQGWLLDVDRWGYGITIPRGRIRQMTNILRWKRRFAPRLESEARRRGQSVPVVHPELLTRAR